MPHFKVYEKMEMTFEYEVEAVNATEAALAIEAMVGDGKIIEEDIVSIRVKEYTPAPPRDPNQYEMFFEK